MEDWAEIRRLHRAEGVGVKAIARRLGIARNTVRAALASDGPPRYQRAGKQSLVDAAEPEVRELLVVDAKMPATVIAERIGWEHSLTILKDRIRRIRPEYAGVDPADRIVHEPGVAAQMDLWFPQPRIPVGFGQAAMLPVLVMTLTFSKFLSAVMVPSRQGGDLLAGMWQLISQVGAVSKSLVWDRESAIGGKGVVTQAAAAFAGTLATRVVLAPARDPEFKGMTERNNGYFETSFLPGRSFASPADFNMQLTEWLPRANARTVRSLAGRPIDVLDRDIAAMTALPPNPPATGLQTRVRLGRDYYVRLDGNDYSVDPRMIGRLVDVTATLTRVIVICEGQVVADHERCWANHAVVTDPGHVQTARGLRAMFSAAKRDRERQETLARPGERVMFRDTSDYDTLFGIRFDPTTGEVIG